MMLSGDEILFRIRSTEWYGGFEKDMKHIIKRRSMKWREVSGILYGQRISVRLNCKFYKVGNDMYGSDIKQKRRWV